MDSFLREVDVLCFIIRFGYGVADNDLVPSEILTDFNLAYEAGDWVDEWSCPDEHDVVFVMGEIQRPPDRNIRFEGYPRITPKQEGWHEGTYIDKDGVSRIYYERNTNCHARSRYDVVAEIEIPELDFEKLEEPRKRCRKVPRSWADCSDPGYEVWMRQKLQSARFHERRDRIPDEECVFTLKIGKDAEKAHLARKKRGSALLKQGI